MPANLLEAIEENGRWRLYGTKFFCSAAHADYSALSIGSAGGMARGLREVEKYGEFRTAFGIALKDFPMMAAQYLTNAGSVRRTIAGNFKVYKAFIELPGGLSVGLDGGGLSVGSKADEPPGLRKHRFDVRQLVLLQKITVAKDAIDLSRLGISAFGGHGVMEDFSSFPRMFRDGMVNELWEGPRNVLLTQLFMDFQKVRTWYPPNEFVGRILKGADAPLVRGFAKELEEILETPHLFDMDEKTIAVCGQWDDFCERFFHAYQDLALAEAEAAG